MPPLPRFLTQSVWRKIKFRRTTPCRRETSFGSFYLSKIRDLRTSSENSSKLLATTSAIQYKRYSRVQKLARNSEFRTEKPAVVSQQCVVYQFKCDLCDTDYIGYTTRHLHPRIEEHRATAVGAHVKGCHGISNPELLKQFSVLKKCQGKLDCLIREMLFIREKKPKLNTQSDSIRAKVFV